MPTDPSKQTTEELIRDVGDDDLGTRQRAQDELARRGLRSETDAEKIRQALQVTTDAEVAARLNEIVVAVCRYFIYILSVKLVSKWSPGFDRRIEFKFGTDESQVSVTTPEIPVEKGATRNLGPPNVGIYVFSSIQHGDVRFCRKSFKHKIFARAVDYGETEEDITIVCDGSEQSGEIVMAVHWSEGLHTRDGVMKFQYRVETRCGL